MSPEDRLRAIDRMWHVEINAGRPFLSNPALVPVLRDLLEGYDHPDTLPPPDEEDDGVDWAEVARDDKQARDDEAAALHAQLVAEHDEGPSHGYWEAGDHG